MWYFPKFAVYCTVYGNRVVSPSIASTTLVDWPILENCIFSFSTVFIVEKENIYGRGEQLRAYE